MFKLAWTSIRHRISRTLITILSMALAAAAVTSGMSLSKGIAKMAYSEYRNYYGGDIVCFTPTYVGATAVYDTESNLEHSILYDSGFNPLLGIYPHFSEEGYLGYTAYPYGPIKERMLSELARYPGIRAVSPTMLMPGRIGSENVNVRVATSITGNSLSDGVLPSESKMLEAVVNGYGWAVPQVGEVVTLHLPAFGLGTSGVPYSDLSAGYTEHKAKVVGVAGWPTRELVYFPPGAGGAGPRYEQGYVHSAEVYITPEDWERLWQEHSGGKEYPVLSASLTVDNLSQLNVIAASLRTAFPELTIKTVPELAKHVEKYSLLDHFYTIPQDLWRFDNGAVTHEYVPVELGIVSSILLFANAGMLLAGQMLSGIAERRKEIGVLKALGARKVDIMGMVLLEGLLLAVTGSLLGFGFMRLLAIQRDVTNSLPWLVILSTTLREMLTVMGLTTAVALLFSAIPAVRTAQLTVMEVFRND